MFYSRSAGTLVERKAKKKTVTTDLITARGKPIWLRNGKVNKVRRIGALPWGQTKKLPWVEALAAELAILPSGQCGDPQPVGLTGESKARRCSPLFCPVPDTAGTFRGPKPATRSVRTSHPMKWSWHLNALPRFGQPSEWRMAGEVIGQGRKRSGAVREVHRFPVAPRISGKRSYA